MKEKIFNLFVYSNLDIISQVGAICHEIEGNDKEKLSFLKSRVNIDFNNVEYFSLPEKISTLYKGLKRNSIDYNTYRELSYRGEALMIFENVFIKYNAVKNPLVVVTPVRNGKIQIDGQENIKMAEKEFTGNIEIEKQNDWLVGYIDNNGFHLDQLINDDFFEAIRILYKQDLCVSAMKLLMICIDTVSYLEFGDISGNFQKWINLYTKLSDLNITANELWEFRNSILHMTNLDSRKVKQNKERRLMFYVSHPETKYQDESDEGKFFNFIDLLNCIAWGISKWGQTYNTEKSKFEEFVARYDRILSDKRMTYIRYKH
ncbi:hypothetical protein [Sinomicrobium sp. M5D2P9]